MRSVKAFEIPKPERPKIFAIFAVFLPLITAFFLGAKWLASDIVGANFYSYTVLAFIALTCSIILFFAYSRGTVVELIAGIIYAIMVFFVLALLFIILMFEGSGRSDRTLLTSEPSPNSVHIAEMHRYISGSWLADPIWTATVRQNRDVNLLVGELRKSPTTVFVRGDELAYRTQFRWESDYVFYIYYARPSFAGGGYDPRRYIITNHSGRLSVSRAEHTVIRRVE